VVAVSVTVRCFGNFTVHVNGRPVQRWRAGRARSLFQYLLLNRGRTVRREKLFEVLWPHSEWSPTASSLKVAMHALRRILAETDAVSITSQDHGYLLHADDIWVDLTEFDTQMDRGRAAEEAGDHGRALAAYQRAATLYTGDFLESEPADWATSQRECTRTQALHALGYLRAEATRREDHSQVIALCRRILEIDPYHEEIYQTLMLLHGRRGELGQVRNWHQLCVRRLQHDLDVAPTDTTRRIFARAVRGELREPVRLAS
jgi:DNA-binding SARP family transcriptional activator